MTRFNFTALQSEGPEQTLNETSCGTYEARRRMAGNLLQVNVFFQTLNVQTITEEPKYQVYCI